MPYFTLRLCDEDHDALKELAAGNGVSMNRMVALLIQKEQPPEQSPNGLSGDLHSEGCSLPPSVPTTSSDLPR